VASQMFRAVAVVPEMEEASDLIWNSPVSGRTALLMSRAEVACAEKCHRMTRSRQPRQR
jgi:hypothetical protein